MASTSNGTGSGHQRPPWPMMPAPTGDLRLHPNGYGFARTLIAVPLSIDEFGGALASFPILFSQDDGFPLVLLKLGRANSFVDGGCWDSAAYMPGYIRRFPFVIGETESGQAAVMIDYRPEAVLKGSGEGEVLFTGGHPSPLAESMLAECRAYLEGNYRQTCLFVEALQANSLLILPEGRFGLPRITTPFEIVDRSRLDGLGTALIRDWAAKGWLTLIDQHLSSLARFSDLLERERRLGSQS